MSNDAYWALCREWSSTESKYCDEFGDFIENEYPRVFEYLTTEDAVGHYPLCPYPFDMKIILKEWQKNHGYFDFKVGRIVRGKNDMSLIVS